jgi:hypothetical protein
MVEDLQMLLWADKGPLPNMGEENPLAACVKKKLH